MSGIYIKGMTMPKSRNECKMFDASHAIGLFAPLGWCRINGKEIFRLSEKANCCPLIPVPEHGRLIDADALTDAIESTDWYHQASNKEMVHGANSAEHQAWYKEQEIYSAIANAPTIIPADKEDT